jgi:Tol biopolymer transport system component
MGTRRVTEQLRTITGVAWWGDELVFSTKLGGPFQLWTVPVSAGKPVVPRWLPVGAAETHSPSTSIDGSKLVFQSDLSVVNTKVWRSDDPDITSDFALSARVDISPALSPDGSRAAFVSSRRGTREIWIQRMDGTGLQQLTDIAGGYVDSPVWSPDGSQIMFAASVDANSDLYSINVASRKVARVTTNDADDMLPQYRPGGESVAFASDRSGDWQIWELDLVSGAEKMLTKEGGLAVRFHPDGRRVFIAGPHHPGIRLLKPDGSLGEVVVPDLHELDWGAWDVVAGGIFYVVRSSSHPWLGFLEFKRGDAMRVVQLSERDVWSVPWGRTVLDAAPDGSTVLFSRYDQAESEVVLVTTTNANGPAR